MFGSAKPEFGQAVRPEAVVLGASAGAFDALTVILSALPAEFDLPIIVVVHLPPEKNSLMPSLLQARCRIAVREAEDKEPIVGSTVYFAPRLSLAGRNRPTPIAIERRTGSLFPTVDRRTL